MVELWTRWLAVDVLFIYIARGGASPALFRSPKHYSKALWCVCVWCVYYLILHGGHISQISVVDLLGGFDKVGLHEQGSLHSPLCLVFVAIHDLPELLMCLKNKNNFT